VRRGAPSNTQTLICLTVTGLQRNMSMPFGDEKNITENSKEKGTGSIQDNLFIITACMASTVTRVLWYRMSVLYDDVCFLSRGI
jgi:hypothetical protein